MSLASVDLPDDSLRFPRRLRLQHALEYERVYGSKIYGADQVLVINGCANGASWTRLGLSISRSVGMAVVRNRWKRLLREAFRRNRRSIPLGLDLVVRPKRGAVAEYGSIERSLVRLSLQVAKRAGVPLSE